MIEKPVKPAQADVIAVERQYGRLPARPTQEQCAERYRLCQAEALFRLFAEAHLGCRPSTPEDLYAWLTEQDGVA